MKRLALLTATALALAAAWASTRDTARSPFTPLPADARFTTRGTVRERLRAGPYVYLRLDSERGEAWVATLSDFAPDTDLVEVSVLSRVAHFHSPRLRRDFDDLWLGLVRPAEPQFTRSPSGADPMKTFAAAMSMFTCLSCVTPPAPTTDAGDATCAKDLVEPDFQFDPRWQGPGVTAEQRLPPPPDGGTYLLTTTYLELRAEPAAQQTFQKVVGPTVQTLATWPGLVGFQFGESKRCNVQRTFTVWRDEKAMYDFVASDAHLEAMAVVDDVSRGRSTSAHWKGTEADATWTMAREKLRTTGRGEF